jgi:acyl transferase domain-containing protein
MAAEAVAALALNVALAQLLERWGAEAILTAGVGLGEVSAACIAGAVAFVDAVNLLAAGPDGSRACELTDRNREPRLRVVSGSTGQLVTQDAATTDYWRSIDWEVTAVDRAVETLLENRAEVLLHLGAESNVWDAARQRLDAPARVLLGGLPEGACPWRHVLHQLAELYARGTPVNFQAFDRDYSRRRVELPTYPFQRKRFWSEPARVALSGKYPSRDPCLHEGPHPVLGRRIHTALQPEQIVYETILDTRSPLLPAESDPDQPCTVGESVFQEMADAAATVAMQANDVQLDSLVTHEPLVLKPQRLRIVQLALLPDRENAYRLEIFSRDGSEANNPQTWQQHVSARLLIQ